jgi:hypothetical protein
LRLAFETLILVEFGTAAVVRLTSVTGKLIAAGTVMLTVSWAPAHTTVAAQATMPRTTTRITHDPPDPKLLTDVYPA